MLELRPALWTINLAQSVIRPQDLAPLIDHTCLDPKADSESIETACEEALQFSFAAVCVSSKNIECASRALADSKVLPIAVVGFPLGSEASVIKLNEAVFCVKSGAKEIDMVVSIADLKAGKHSAIETEISSLVKECAPYAVKVILETSELTSEEITVGSKIAATAGAKFVKTSTGFASGGATIESVRLMHSAVGAQLGVKASGGIRDFAFAQQLVRAGANRLGTSHGVRILKSLSAGSGY